MTQARALPDNATEWWIYLGVLVLYLLTRWLLAWNQARREGAEHPVRTAFEDEEPQEAGAGAAAVGAFRSYRQLLGFVAAAVVVTLVAALTEGGVRLALMCTLVPVAVVLLAYLDFRRARTHRLGQGRT
ncbi:hypothetical protein ACFTXO_17410 [Streptomyces sp. NPDC057067]|uniref:hypothetical protein n=1 Tax=Streptomyces TaxID=1883 RepID=UPI00100E4DEB|nr:MULTISPECIES: hypothetical protein [Streptomyces]MBL1287258.1 hypothetical protein [Streptomyces silvae]